MKKKTFNGIKINIKNSNNSVEFIIHKDIDIIDSYFLFMHDKNSPDDLDYINSSVVISKEDYDTIYSELKDITSNWKNEYIGEEQLKWDVLIDNKKIIGDGSYPPDKWLEFLDLAKRCDNLYFYHRFRNMVKNKNDFKNYVIKRLNHKEWVDIVYNYMKPLHFNDDALKFILDSNLDIAKDNIYEYIDSLNNDGFNDETKISAGDYTPKKVKNQHPEFDICGVYSFLDYIKENPEKDISNIQELFPITEQNGKTIGFIEQEKTIRGSIIGFIVGDALGVPFEFKDRESIKGRACDMTGYGTHNQPTGTWSDDTSMVLATIDGLLNSKLPAIDYKRIMNNFLDWFKNSNFTATDTVFDIGNGTRRALELYQKNKKRKKENNFFCGGVDIHSNGNGSLMRMLPISLLLYYSEIDFTDNAYLDIIKYISSLTHAHDISVIACYLYSMFIYLLLNGFDKRDAYNEVRFMGCDIVLDSIQTTFSRLLKGDISKLSKNEIKSSGYVVDTLEAVFWVILNTDNYKDAVLTAVNLGDDTDTIAAITGSIAGIIYGLDDIPKEWIDSLQKKDYVINLTNKYTEMLLNNKINLLAD